MNGAVSALKPRHKMASNGKPLNVVPTNHNSEVLQVQDLIMSSSSSSFSSMKLRVYGGKASFMTWRLHDILHVAKHHWIPCVFAMGLLFFMGVEYTLRMVPSSSPPFDVGFVTTRSLHLLLASKPKLNTLLAGLNTVFVGMQTTYIVWTWLVEGRPRATISALFMFTCRGILGYSTQLPLPQGFLGSGADFPVGNVSFFLFFSGHVAGSVIASLDMRRMQRWEMAWTFDALNVLQSLRLLGTRGHYTIDLAVGVGAGFLFDSLAGKYEESKKSKAPTKTGTKDAFFL
ncbi:phosphatidylcholine:diacylglycerol cholinephosphotransferase 1 [Prunus yedoensis var. nudiflora]|uniref:Phosphatidylcholine:diacylglycerol cholinephosphotransferase 1 n=1 Tax=Prunus yedoensis var. nudiflora TaxID=2094558 RepID=A0A314ZK53_PRUYE|nr:phosphatidylcholine:diacylglycerol cholinephosphotransferase 1 [Prunus yedoensis var. nudiflora]